MAVGREMTARYMYFDFRKIRLSETCGYRQRGKKMTSFDAAYKGICQKHFQPDDISNAPARIDDKSSRDRLKPKH